MLKEWGDEEDEKREGGCNKEWHGVGERKWKVCGR